METSENTPQSRRFSLGDALILIGALALMLVVLRSDDWFFRFPGRIRFWYQVFSGLLGVSSWSIPSLTRADAAYTVILQIIDELLVHLLGCLLLALTLVQPVMRLHAPRPQLRELVRQSGFVLCLAVIIGTLISVDLWVSSGIELPEAAIPASVLLLLWPILGLPPWRKESSWIDRLGRAVGWGWIVSTSGVMVLRYA